MQLSWVMSAGVDGGANVPSAPFVTRTITFASFPSFTSTSSDVIGVFAQNGSASRLSFAGVGGVPVKATVTLTAVFSPPVVAAAVPVAAAPVEADAAVLAAAGVVAGV